MMWAMLAAVVLIVVLRLRAKRRVKRASLSADVAQGVLVALHPETARPSMYRGKLGRKHF